MVNVGMLFDQTNNWLVQLVEPKLVDISKNSKSQIKIVQRADDAVGYDVLFILGYTKILPQKLLQQNKLNLVVHESNLPQGRGFAPVQWQVLEGKNEIIVSLLVAEEVVDSGDIVLQTTMLLVESDLYDEIRFKQAQATIELIEKFLSSYPAYERRAQQGASSTYKRRTPQNSELDINKSIDEQFNLLRICNNEDWPAFFEKNGQKYYLKIYKC